MSVQKPLSGSIEDTASRLAPLLASRWQAYTDANAGGSGWSLWLGARNFSTVNVTSSSYVSATETKVKDTGSGIDWEEFAWGLVADPGGVSGCQVVCNIHAPVDITSVEYAAYFTGGGGTGNAVISIYTGSTDGAVTGGFMGSSDGSTTIHAATAYTNPAERVILKISGTYNYGSFDPGGLIRVGIIRSYTASDTATNDIRFYGIWLNFS